MTSDTPTPSHTPTPSDTPTPAPAPASASASAQPQQPPLRPVPGGPDNPTTRPRRGLGTANRGRGANEILNTPLPTTTTTTANLKRTNRVLTLPPATADRIKASRLYRADLIMSALRTHGDTVRTLKASRPTTPGRTRFNVALNDHEYSQLQRLATTRGWSVSALVSVLTNLYLDTHQPNPPTP